MKLLSESLPPKKKKLKRPKTAKHIGDEDSYDGEPYGIPIPEKKTQLIPPLKKEEWKYWKPWINEPKLPKWAERIMD